MQIHNVALWKKIYTLHDPNLLPQAEDWLFEPDALQERQLIQGKSTGRRHAFLFRLNHQDYVLRHFWRGGLIGRVLDDSYLWSGLKRCRPVCEWNLLTQLHQQELPVPRPAALRVIRRGMVYRADLITIHIPNVGTLADQLTQTALEPDSWRSIGATIAKIHRCGAYHADLNARNILLSKDNTSAYLIDWDRGKLRPPAEGWQQSNLQRLRRSLNKISRSVHPFYYTPSCFDHLLAGYRSAC